MDTDTSPAAGSASKKAIMSLLADTIILSKLQAELIVELFLTCLNLNGSAQKMFKIPKLTLMDTEAAQE